MRWYEVHVHGEGRGVGRCESIYVKMEGIHVYMYMKRNRRESTVGGGGGWYV